MSGQLLLLMLGGGLITSDALHVGCGSLGLVLSFDDDVTRDPDRLGRLCLALSRLGGLVVDALQVCVELVDPLPGTLARTGELGQFRAAAQPPGRCRLGDITVGPAHDHSAVGLGSIVLPGVTIGRGAWLASGVVAGKDVSEQTLAFAKTEVLEKKLHDLEIKA